MDKIEFLESYERAKYAEKRTRERIKEYRERERIASAIRYTAMPKAGDLRDMSDYICSVESLCEELEQCMHISDHIKEAICHSLDSLEEQDEWDVLFLKFIKGMRMGKIAEYLYLSRRATYYIYERAIENLVISDIDVKMVEAALAYKRVA